MKFRGMALGLLVAVLGGVMGAGSPAAAPGVEWADVAGDATALPGMESSPRPSDPELDILKTSFASGDRTLSATMRLERLGSTADSQASAYRFYFSFNKQRYYFEALLGTMQYATVYGIDPGFYRMGTGEAADEKLECFCMNDFDFKRGLVTFKVSRVDVARALRVPGFGVELADLEGRTLRASVDKYEADMARAPKGTTHQL